MLFTSIRRLVARIRAARGEQWASTLKSARNVQLNPSSDVWNRTFPAAYANILNFISYELLKSPLPTMSTTIKKFIRSCDNTL